MKIKTLVIFLIPLLVLSGCKDYMEKVRSRALEKKKLSLLKAICPQEIKTDKDGPYCPVCPDFTSDAGHADELRIQEVYSGDFRGMKKEEAIITTLGCEPGFSNPGGTVFLSRESGKWEKRGYLRDLLHDCKKIRIEEKDSLVCLASSMVMGIIEGSVIHLIIEQSGRPEWYRLLPFHDDSGNCISGTYSILWPEAVVPENKGKKTTRVIIKTRFEKGRCDSNGNKTIEKSRTFNLIWSVSGTKLVPEKETLAILSKLTTW